MAVARAQAPVPGRSLAISAHFADPLAELRQEQVVGHGDAELAALHGLGAFVGGLELRVHPLVAQEAGAILGDAVAAHEAHRFAHHVRAVAGVPQLAGGAEDVGHRIEQRVLHQNVVPPARAACRRRYSMASFWTGRMALSMAEPPVMPRSARMSFFRFSSGSSWSNSARRFEAQRSAGLAGGPDVHQAVHHVLLELQAQFIARRAGAGDGTAPEPPALVADHRLDAPRAAWPKVMIATVTRVRRKTASMISPWV